MNNIIRPLIYKFLALFAFIFSIFFLTDKGHTKEIKLEDYIYKKQMISSNIQEINEPYFIMESGLMILKFKAIDIRQRLTSRIKEYDLIYDHELKHKLDSLNKVEYNYLDFNDEEKKRLCFIFTDLLEDGKFLLKEKKSNKIIRDIIIGYYDYNPEPLRGHGGRLFFLPDGEIFLYQVDRSY